MNHQINTIEQLLKPILGRNTVVYEDDQRFHPSAVVFYNDEPKSSFTGVVKTPVFETNLLLGEMDDDRLYRMERSDNVLIYIRFERSSSHGTMYATGQAVICEKGSDVEAVFVMKAMADVMEAASEPLRSAMRNMRDAGLFLSPPAEAHLRKELFG